MDNNIKPDELEKLEQAETKTDWDNIVDEIKSNHRCFPSDWSEKVIFSGMMNKIGMNIELSFFSIRTDCSN